MTLQKKAKRFYTGGHEGRKEMGRKRGRAKFVPVFSSCSSRSLEGSRLAAPLALQATPLRQRGQARETSRNGARSRGATERFLDFFDGHTVGLIVRLVILVMVALKGKQLVSIAFPDHCNVNAPFHPGF